MIEAVISKDFLEEATKIAEKNNCEIVCISNVGLSEDRLRLTLMKKDDIRKLYDTIL